MLLLFFFIYFILIFFLFIFFFFFFNDTATTEIYTLSLHDALPISQFQVTLNRRQHVRVNLGLQIPVTNTAGRSKQFVFYFLRSEEHTSELQSQSNLVCRLLLEKKKKKKKHT